MDEQAAEQAPALRTPDWNYWRLRPAAPVFDLVLLSLNVEPHYCLLPPDLAIRHVRRETVGTERDLADRLNLAIRNLAPEGALQPILKDGEVRHGTFEADAALTVRTADFVAVFGDAWPELRKLEAARNAEHPLAGWEGFDETAENYPPELDIALQAWRHVTTNDTGAGRTPKQRLLAYLDRTHPGLTPEARKRIAQVANWNPQGGRPDPDD